MRRFASGLAIDADLVRAAASAAESAQSQLAGRPDLACVFVCGSDPDENAGALERAAGIIDAKTVVGCSAAGVIGAARGIESTSSVSVWAGILPGARIRAFHLEVIRTPAGMAVLGLPGSEPADRIAMMFVDPHSFPAEGFVKQANETAGVPFVGGIATGARGPGSTRLHLDGRTVDRGAVGVMLGGPVGAVARVSQGCRPVGPAMTVTKAEGNLVLELAGVPAVTKIEQVLAQLTAADQALATDGLQLGVAIDEYAEDHDRGDFLVRTILGIDRARGGFAIADVLAVGSTVRFQVRDAATADDDLRATLLQLRDGFDSIDGALLFSCNGRGSNLFTSSDHDVLALRQGLSTSGIGGFFGAGEIGPVGGRNHLHGFSASVLVFGTQRQQQLTIPDVSPDRAGEPTG